MKSIQSRKNRRRKKEKPHLCEWRKDYRNKQNAIQSICRLVRRETCLPCLLLSFMEPDREGRSNIQSLRETEALSFSPAPKFKGEVLFTQRPKAKTLPTGKVWGNRLRSGVG